MLDFNPKYPKEPKSLGEKLRKTRMDNGMTLKEVAALFGVSDTAVLNWEIRGKVPQVDRMQKVTEFLSERFVLTIPKIYVKWNYVFQINRTPKR